jgi:hypothetical protein
MDDDAQDQLVQELLVGLGIVCNGDGEQEETMTWEEAAKEFEHLDPEHMADFNDVVRKFADDAVGSPHWDSDR